MNSVRDDDGRARERQAALVVARRLVHALARLAEHQRPRRPAVVRALEDSPYGFVRHGLAVHTPRHVARVDQTAQRRRRRDGLDDAVDARVGSLTDLSCALVKTSRKPWTRMATDGRAFRGTKLNVRPRRPGGAAMA